MLLMAMAAARRGGLRSAYPEHAYQGYELEADEVQAAPPSALVSQPRRGTGRAASGDDGSVGLAAAAPAVSDAAVALLSCRRR